MGYRCLIGYTYDVHQIYAPTLYTLHYMCKATASYTRTHTHTPKRNIPKCIIKSRTELHIQIILWSHK